MKRIISVSRRTDIPAFYSDWFIRRLKEGYVQVENPYNHTKEIISLLPNDVFGFVFWSRYPKPLIKYLDWIGQKYSFNHYLHLTLNNYPRILEPNNPQIELVLRCVDELNQRYGSKYIIWRYDPLIISNVTPETWVLENFEYLCSRFEKKVEICITSFVDIYSKVKKNFEKLRISTAFKFVELSLNSKAEIIKKMEGISGKFGISLKLCCESQLGELVSLPLAGCVNPDFFPCPNLNSTMKFKFAPSRKDCVCIESKDIGFYNSCLFGCQYCYAVNNREGSLKKYKYLKFNPEN
ncbi:MAG: DUF1848 family protein [Candidatus Kapaibacteriales bacterium]